MANNNPWTSDVILVMTAWVVTTYNSITSALSKARAMDKAAEILARMLKNGVTYADMPDCITYTSLVHGYC
uniref:Uncharacterized protein n=1 Tax=Oryza sativa subsp. japonica TaxID=39947 RepID=Q69TU2_ORYSJ|nr:hypothetical protein [Oryza sativa Japonica Group]